MAKASSSRTVELVTLKGHRGLSLASATLEFEYAVPECFKAIFFDEKNVQKRPKGHLHKLNF